MSEVLSSETAIEAVPSISDESKIDAILALAKRVDTLGPAMDKIRTFTLKRAFPGDWVQFSIKGAPAEDATLELTGAAADRIAADLGISFVDWKEPRKETFSDENGEGYTWWYQCAVKIGERIIERVEGRAGTRDKFFGRAYGQWKALKDINEADIKTAARHNCMKEGVKLLLGIRRIPRAHAATMGLDLGKVRSADFEGKPGGANGAAHEDDKAGTREIVVADVMQKKGEKNGKPWVMYTITGDRGFSATTFDVKIAEGAKFLKGQRARATVEVSGKFTTLKDIRPMGEEEPSKTVQDDMPA